MNLTTRLLRSQLNIMKPFVEGCSLETTRKGQDRLGALMASTQRHEVSRSNFSHEGCDYCLVTPKDEITDGIILYLHGGGYTCGDITYAKGFGSVLSAKCGIKVLCCAYRLAPEAVFPAAVDDALASYKYLLSCGYKPSQILLCGESAGGGLIYSLCLKLKELQMQLPAGIIAVSPWTDLTLSGESYIKNKSVDPSIVKETLKFYADCYMYGKSDESTKKRTLRRSEPDPIKDYETKKNPLASPLFGDLCGMPPSLIFVGGDEILLDDSVKLHEKLIACGNRSNIIVTPHMWHAYVLYCLNENEGDFEKMRRFIKSTVPHQKKLRWMSLDNAAKIYPAARRRNWSNLFRLSATLNEKIDTSSLKVALDVTVRRFPSIAVRLRAGAFWYYLEEIPEAPEIMDEKAYPLSRMFFDDIRKCAFRVIVYENRIAVEFFHALADGNGGLVFLKTLVAEYLYQKYGVKVPCENGVLDRLEEPSKEELEDSFLKYEGKVKAKRSSEKAFKLSGTPENDGFRTNTTFILNAEEIHKKAREKNITVTAYMTAALILAVENIQRKQVRHRKKMKPIKVLVPVNLRKLFPSNTLRNFVLFSTPRIDQRLGDYSFDELCSIVYHTMGLEITAKNMSSIIAANVGDEKSTILSLTPLFLKNLVMKLVYNAVGESTSCFTFSNLGVVKIPEEMQKYVTRLDFVLGVQSCAPYNIGFIAYNGKAYLNIIRNIKEPLLEKEFYRVLRNLGIHVCAESNTRKEK